MGTTGIKRGIIQSRGLGDIIIALPIARHYWELGDEIHWPVCEEFYSSVVNSVPWVKWYSIPTDDQGAYFLQTPLQVFAANGVDPNLALYLYQYLSSNPELTNPELFNILKFDQYKYAAAKVPFLRKWDLEACVVRDLDRETLLQNSLGIVQGERYTITSLKGSNFSAAGIDLKGLDPAARIIDVDAHATDCVFDWLGVLEGAEHIVCVDSAVANLVDQWRGIGAELYWIRRSAWDVTPVQGRVWRVIPTNLPIREPARVDPAAAAAAQKTSGSAAAGLTSHVPFETNRAGYPTSFMSALKK